MNSCGNQVCTYTYVFVFRYVLYSICCNVCFLHCTIQKIEAQKCILYVRDGSSDTFYSFWVFCCCCFVCFLVTGCYLIFRFHDNYHCTSALLCDPRLRVYSHVTYGRCIRSYNIELHELRTECCEKKVKYGQSKLNQM